MLKKIDDFLNKITMYRLTLYCVIFLWMLALVFGIFGIIKLNPVNLVLSLAIIFAVCFAANEIFAKIYQAPTNRESVYITTFILASIISPFNSANSIIFLVLAAILAMASKYILAVGKKHIFNPAAAGAVLAALITGQAATWWMGTFYMAPFVLIAGLLICRKIKRFDLFLSFIITSLAFTIWYGFKAAIVDSPMLYLGGIMLTEPMTTPPTRNKRIFYGALVGLLNAPFIGIGSYFSTPEIALVIGNIFSYFASPKEKLILTLKEKNLVAKDTYDFVFNSDKKLNFKAGQYLEWTLGHKKNDNRGMRRYFTIASSPTEKEIIMGIKFYENPSSYKKALLAMTPGGKIVASQLTGDFTLPENKNKKLVFIAGGIGVTPFRSMIKYLLDKNEKRDIVIFYSNKSAGDIAYKNIFDEAFDKLGIKTIYHLTDKDGFLNAEIIKKYAPDFAERMFFISGPRSLILAFDTALKEAGVHKNHIKTDYFPGFA